MHSMPALVTEESGPLTPVTIEVTSTTCFLEDMTMKTTFSVPYRIANMECEDSDFSGTINEIRDAILRFIKVGGITRSSPVYTFDITTKTAVKYPEAVGDLLDDLERWIAKGHGDDRWQFDRDDGWHDPVVSLISYHRRSGSVLLVEVEAGYQEDAE